MNIYAKILSYILGFTLCPIVIAFGERITLPVFHSTRKTSFIAIHYTVVMTIVTVVVVMMWRAINFVSMKISSDFIKVVVYIIILALISNEKIYSPWKKLGIAWQGSMWALSKMIFTFLPLKTILYFASTLCLIASQLQSLNLYEFSPFWAEFFSYHEYALLIVFSVNEIGEHFPLDMARIRQLLNSQSRKELLGFNPEPLKLSNKDEGAEVYISYPEKERKIKKEIRKRLEAEGIRCYESVEYHNDIYIEKYKKRLEQCKVFITVMADSSMEHEAQMQELSAALNIATERELSVFMYNVTDKPCTGRMSWLAECVPPEHCFDASQEAGGDSAAETLLAAVKEKLCC